MRVLAVISIIYLFRALNDKNLYRFYVTPELYF